MKIAITALAATLILAASTQAQTPSSAAGQAKPSSQQKGKQKKSGQAKRQPVLGQIVVSESKAEEYVQREADPAAGTGVAGVTTIGPLESQVVLRKDGGGDVSPLRPMLEKALAQAVNEWEQPDGGRTVVRLNGVWQEGDGQWRLAFRVVADHLNLEKSEWTRLGDSKTVTVTDLPGRFEKTLIDAVRVAADLAIEGSTARQ